MKTLLLKTHNNTNVQAKLLAKFLQTSGAEVIFEAEEENDIWPADSFDDDKAVKYVEREMERGNFYAWFCAKVTVKYRGYEATDYLGACSYKSERDFKENSGYYIDMINQCIAEINRDIEAHNKEVCHLFNVRKLKQLAESLNYFVIPKTAINS